MISFRWMPSGTLSTKRRAAVSRSARRASSRTRLIRHAVRQFPVAEQAYRLAGSLPCPVRCGVNQSPCVARPGEHALFGGRVGVRQVVEQVVGAVRRRVSEQ